MDLTQTEKTQLKAFLITVYGPSANAWPMRNEMLNLTFKMLRESRKCSDIMDIVPRPIAFGQPATKWLQKQLRSTLLRKLQDQKKHYAACVSTSAWKMRTDFEIVAKEL